MQTLGGEVVTSFEYDVMNRQAKTVFADGTFVVSAYDLRGNKIAEYGNTTSVQTSTGKWSITYGYDLTKTSARSSDPPATSARRMPTRPSARSPLFLTALHRRL